MGLWMESALYRVAICECSETLLQRRLNMTPIWGASPIFEFKHTVFPLIKITVAYSLNKLPSPVLIRDQSLNISTTVLYKLQALINWHVLDTEYISRKWTSQYGIASATTLINIQRTPISSVITTVLISDPALTVFAASYRRLFEEIRHLVISNQCKHIILYISIFRIIYDLCCTYL